MLFVERIDVAAEAVRSPEEIGRMLREAEGQIGALTGVIGGTCVVSNLCPSKFACIGCSGNAPDPERRYQIETKRTWALEQITWAHREHLPAVGQADIVRAFHVPKVTVKRYVKRFREGSGKDCFAPRRRRRPRY